MGAITSGTASGGEDHVTAKILTLLEAIALMISLQAVNILSLTIAFYKFLSFLNPRHCAYKFPISDEIQALHLEAVSIITPASLAAAGEVWFKVLPVCSVDVGVRQQQSFK